MYFLTKDDADWVKKMQILSRLQGGANKQEDLRKSEKKLWIKISLTRI